MPEHSRCPINPGGLGGGGGGPQGRGRWVLVDRSWLYPAGGLAGALPSGSAVHTSVRAQGRGRRSGVLDLSLGPEAELRPAGGQPCAQRRSQSKWNPEKAVGAPLPKPGPRPGRSGLPGRRRPAGSTPRPTGAAHTLSPPPASAQRPSREMGVSCGSFQGPGRGRGAGLSEFSSCQHLSGTGCRGPRPVCPRLH